MSGFTPILNVVPFSDGPLKHLFCPRRSPESLAIPFWCSKSCFLTSIYSSLGIPLWRPLFSYIFLSFLCSFFFFHFFFFFAVPFHDCLSEADSHKPYPKLVRTSQLVTAQRGFFYRKLVSIRDSMSASTGLIPPLNGVGILRRVIIFHGPI